MPVAGVAAPMPAVVVVVVAAAACAFVVVVVAAVAARTCLDSRGSPRWMAPIGRQPVVAAAAVVVAVAAAGGPSCQRNRSLAGPRERGGR